MDKRCFKKLMLARRKLVFVLGRRKKMLRGRFSLSSAAGRKEATAVSGVKIYEYRDPTPEQREAYAKRCLAVGLPAGPYPRHEYVSLAE